MRKLSLFAVTAVMLAVPSSATAQGSHNAPPGNSSIDQYFESVPSADGSSTTTRPGEGGATAPGVPGTGGEGGGGSGSGGSAGIDSKIEKRLAAQGADGRAVESFTRATRPGAAPGGPGTPENANGDRGAVAGVAAADRGKGTISSVIETATQGSSNGGMGAALPFLIALALMGAVAAVLLRRRRLLDE